MKRNRSVCLCGYEGRVDTVNEHKKKCRGYNVIASLQEENKSLKLENEKLKSVNDTSNLFEEIARLRNEIETLRNRSHVTNITNNHIVNNNNIIIYGNEEQPKALAMVRDLCRQGVFAEVVPKYIEMKHFPDEGGGNIRINDDTLEVYKENGWEKRDKDRELAKITKENTEEVVEKYGEKPIANFFRDWMANGAGKTIEEQQDVKTKVEDMIKKHS